MHIIFITTENIFNSKRLYEYHNMQLSKIYICMAVINSWLFQKQNKMFTTLVVLEN